VVSFDQVMINGKLDFISGFIEVFHGQSAFSKLYIKSARMFPVMIE
jgi:hypothetical protein